MVNFAWKIKTRNLRKKKALGEKKRCGKYQVDFK